MTTKQGERMAIIETKVDNIEIHLKQQSSTLAKIESKLDNSITEHQTIMHCKADKTEVKQIWSIIYSIAGGLLLTLLGVIGYLLTKYI